MGTEVRLLAKEKTKSKEKLLEIDASRKNEDQLHQSDNKATEEVRKIEENVVAKEKTNKKSKQEEERGAEAVDEIVDAITQVCSTQVMFKEGEVSIGGKEAGTMNRIESKKEK